MTPIDHFFMILLLVVQPVYGVYEARRHDALEKAGTQMNRIRFYRETMLIEWIFLAALFAAWIILGRQTTDFGFTTAIGLGFWAGAALVGLFTGFLLYGWRRAVQATEAEKAEQTASFGKIIRYLPQSEREYRSFFAVSITAGIVEEIVYRGFVFWYLTHFMPLWVAVVVSSVAFGIAHSYQGMRGALRVTMIGLAFGILYVVTGSIWLPIVAHILLDVLQGKMVLEILRSDHANPEPA